MLPGRSSSHLPVWSIPETVKQEFVGREAPIGTITRLPVQRSGSHFFQLGKGPRSPARLWIEPKTPIDGQQRQSDTRTIGHRTGEFACRSGCRSASTHLDCKRGRRTTSMERIEIGGLKVARVL